MLTICLTYFRSLTLANLQAALYSVRRQNFDQVDAVVVFDNNTDDSVESLRHAVEDLSFPVPIALVSEKHGDVTKTHAWSTNAVMHYVVTPWVLYTRADYLLSFDAVDRFTSVPLVENRFVVGGYCDVELNIRQCEAVTNWRVLGPEDLRRYGHEHDHVLIDAGVWMTSKNTFDKVGGFDERLTAWGHPQTVFQYKLHQAGVEFVQLPQVVFYHPTHDYETPRDLVLAQQQVESIGLNLTDMWARYTGLHNPYKVTS